MMNHEARIQELEKQVKKLQAEVNEVRRHYHIICEANNIEVY